MRRMKVVSAMSLLLALCACQRIALDRQMEELCTKDGGVKVYETVTLSPAEYDRVLHYKVTAKSTEDYYGPQYRYVRERTVLVGANARPEKGQGRLARTHFAVYRRSDGKLLGENVEYTRAGGDGFTFGFHPSTNACPRQGISLATSVFLRGE